MLKLITDIHPAPAGFLDAVSGAKARQTLRGAWRRVVRIIPVRRTRSNAGYILLNKMGRLVCETRTWAIIHVFSAPSVGFGFV
jgi:hypothetical protein